MKIFNKILPHLHLIIILYALWDAFTLYEHHDTEMKAITDQIAPIETSIAENKKKITDIEEFKKDLESSQKRVEEVFKNIEKVQKQLPSEVNDIEVYDYFSKEKQYLNLPELEYNAQPEKQEGFYVVKPYELKGSATFLQFLIFLERLSGVDRLFNVKNINVEISTNIQKGRFQLVKFSTIVETYKYNASHQERMDVNTGGTP